MMETSSASVCEAVSSVLSMLEEKRNLSYTLSSIQLVTEMDNKYPLSDVIMRRFGLYIHVHMHWRLLMQAICVLGCLFNILWADLDCTSTHVCPYSYIYSIIMGVAKFQNLRTWLLTMQLQGNKEFQRSLGRPWDSGIQGWTFLRGIIKTPAPSRQDQAIYSMMNSPSPNCTGGVSPRCDAWSGAICVEGRTGLWGRVPWLQNHWSRKVHLAWREVSTGLGKKNSILSMLIVDYVILTLLCHNQ